MRFFFDNNLSPKLARALHQLVEPEHIVEHLTTRFEANAEDALWMNQLAGERELVIVTADIRIGRNRHEVLAWKEAGHTVFFLKPGWLSLDFWAQAQKFTKCFPEVVRRALRASRGSAFLVQTNGKIEELQ